VAGQGAAGHEVRLHVDKDQGGMVLHGGYSGITARFHCQSTA
jgi:hypothetical protein